MDILLRSLERVDYTLEESKTLHPTSETLLGKLSEVKTFCNSFRDTPYTTDDDRSWQEMVDKLDFVMQRLAEYKIIPATEDN
jgi:hypothetical protein